MVLKRSLPVVLLLAVTTAPAAFGQLKDASGKLIAPIAFANQEAITTSFVQAVNQGGTAGGAVGDNTQWLKVEFHYGATTAMTKRYLDAAEFKIWIEGLDPDAPNPTQPSGKGVAVALIGDITYVNVPASKDLYGVVYVHPSTLARYSDEHGFEQYERKYDIHIEAYVGGVLVDAIDKNKEKDPQWFKSLIPVPSLVYRQDQSPFIMADTDRYPALKLSTPAQ